MISAAFYKAEGRLVDKLIRWWTQSRFSHCELVFSNDEMFSADAWTGTTRFTRSFTPAHWELVPITIGEDQEALLYQWCLDRVGKKYDWLGVFGFVLPFIKQDSSRWFCSEICGAALKSVGKVPVGVKTSKLSPQGLYELL